MSEPIEGKDTWEGFRDHFLDAGHFDHDRTKTMIAMQKLWERIPQNDIDKLPGNLVVFAPSMDIAGRVYNPPRGPFIYLSPMLENKRQEEVDAIVARQFAHTLLEHYHGGKGQDRSLTPGVIDHHVVPSEEETNALIASWDFAKTHPEDKV